MIDNESDIPLGCYGWPILARGTCNSRGFGGLSTCGAINLPLTAIDSSTMVFPLPYKLRPRVSLDLSTLCRSFLAGTAEAK